MNRLQNIYSETLNSYQTIRPNWLYCQSVMTKHQVDLTKEALLGFSKTCCRVGSKTLVFSFSQTVLSFRISMTSWKMTSIKITVLFSWKTSSSSLTKLATCSPKVKNSIKSEEKTNYVLSRNQVPTGIYQYWKTDITCSPNTLLL